MDEGTSVLDGSSGAVIVLDVGSVFRDYEVRAVSWQMSDTVEERIVGDVNGLHRCLAGIVFRPEEMDAWISVLESAAERPQEAFHADWAKAECLKSLDSLRAFRERGFRPMENMSVPAVAGASCGR